MKYPSTPNPVRIKETSNNIPVPSYVECPSEVIQKTTNFDGMFLSYSKSVKDTCKNILMMNNCKILRIEYFDDFR